MATIKCMDKEVYERLQRCWGLPVDKDKPRIQDFIMRYLTGWGEDAVCTLYNDYQEENWFGFAIRDKDDKLLLIGGLIYRDNGWESHT